MTRKHSLITRTEKCCPQCGQEFVLAGPTDVLSVRSDGVRPTQVDLVCPECHFPGRATLTETNRFRSVFPSPDATSQFGVAMDNVGWLTASAFRSGPCH